MTSEANSLTEIPIYNTFCTPTWQCNLGEFQKLNKDLTDYAQRLRKASPDLPLRSGENSWQSEQEVHGAPELATFMSFFSSLLKQISANLLVADGERRLELTTVESWLNINPPRATNCPHTHPGSSFSAVYVIKKPVDSGNLVLFDPRPQVAVLLEPPTKIRQTKLEFDIKEGGLIIFPSWLLHSVGLNKSEGERITLALNMRWARSVHSE